MPIRSVVLFLLAALPAAAGAAMKEESCRTCHAQAKFRIQNKKIFDYYQNWKGSPHDEAGLSCASCHGGDPEAAQKEKAHAGILPQSDPKSPVHYTNIPATCGKCHSDIFEHFTKSRHYKMLETTGRGPSCINCHGSLNTRVYYHSVIERACSNCHAGPGAVHPEVIARAGDILSRMNHANGYRKGLAFFYESIGEKKKMAPIEARYEKITRDWHTFDLDDLDKESKALAAGLKQLYRQANERREKRAEDAAQ